MSDSPDQRLRRLAREGGVRPSGLASLAAELARAGRPGEAQATAVRALGLDSRAPVRDLLPPTPVRGVSGLLETTVDRPAAWPGLRLLGAARALRAPAAVRGAPHDLGQGLLGFAQEGPHPGLVALDLAGAAQGEGPVARWTHPGRATPLLALPDLLLVREEPAEGRPARVVGLDPRSGQALEGELDPLLLLLGAGTPVVSGSLAAIPTPARWRDPPGQLLVVDLASLSPRTLQLGPAGVRVLLATDDGGLVVGEPARVRLLGPDGVERWSAQGRALGLIGERVLVQDMQDKLSLRAPADGALVLEAPPALQLSALQVAGGGLALGARPYPLLRTHHGLLALDPRTLEPRWEAALSRRDQVLTSGDAVLVVRRRLLDAVSGREGWPDRVDALDPWSGERLTSASLADVPAAGDAVLVAGRVVLSSYAPDVAGVVVDPA